MVAVSFEKEQYAATEGGNPVYIAVELNADPRRTLTVPLNVTLVNGTGAADFSGVPVSVTFNSGEMSKTFALTVMDDSNDDDDECLILTFGSLPVGVSADKPDTATVFLLDTDMPRLAVSYGAPNYTAAEGGSPAVITVELDADPERTVTVPISVTHNRGASEDDYDGVPVSMTFSRGDRSKTFTVTAIDDSAVDGDERVALSFGPLSAEVYAGNPSTTVVNLVDNDSRLMLVTASFDTRTYLIPELAHPVVASVTGTVTVEWDVVPWGTATVPAGDTRKRDESGGD